MRTILAAAAIAVLIGCASEIEVRPTRLVTAPPGGATYVSAESVSVMLDSGYERTIASGTTFVVAGEVNEGTVYRPVDAVITVEGAHMHEAYPVIDAGRLVGFYLPVASRFHPVREPVPMIVRTE